ncbi:sigma-70 family RNA polymerase sigma factor [Planctomicrobium sp. SH664]|uniref:sigma-70 family RNA polymerase sigma factor n=1 Tax=Planctomicrobium sp. SH664 TaxID=3448125 RepID=UPI003F5B5449
MNADQVFVEQFAAAKGQLRAYITSQATGADAVDEIYQRTSIALWLKRELFDFQRPFIAWAMGFAKIEVQNYLLEQRRQMATLSASALQAIEESFNRNQSEIEERIAALEQCVTKLSPSQQELLRNCYANKIQLQQIAHRQGVTPNSLYLQLKRIRHLLWKCVTTKMAAES